MALIKRVRVKGKVLGYNSWNWGAEPGDVMVNYKGQLFRLVESRGRNKADAGELTPVLVKPPSPDLCAKIIDGEVWWVRSEVKHEQEDIGN